MTQPVEHVAQRGQKARLMEALGEALRFMELFGRPTPMLLTLQEAAERMGVSVTRLKRLIAAGIIIPSRCGEEMMVAISELQRFARPVLRLVRGAKRKHSRKH